MSKAIVLLSGGLDSATALALAREAGHACYALSFRYGQRHSAELAAAQRIAEALGAAEHRTVDLAGTIYRQLQRNFGWPSSAEPRPRPQFW